jgi:hypothetical protein
MGWLRFRPKGFIDAQRLSKNPMQTQNKDMMLADYDFDAMAGFGEFVFAILVLFFCGRWFYRAYLRRDKSDDY